MPFPLPILVIAGALLVLRKKGDTTTEVPAGQALEPGEYLVDLKESVSLDLAGHRGGTVWVRDESALRDDEDYSYHMENDAHTADFLFYAPGIYKIRIIPVEDSDWIGLWTLNVS